MISKEYTYVYTLRYSTGRWWLGWNRLYQKVYILISNKISGQNKKGAKLDKKWAFPISSSRLLSGLYQDILEEKEVWMALICREKEENEKEYVCLLTPNELKDMLEYSCTNKHNRINIHVSLSEDESFRVREGRKKREESLIIPRNRVSNRLIREVAPDPLGLISPDPLALILLILEVAPDILTLISEVMGFDSRSISFISIEKHDNIRKEDV
jgi:hypothetical protein